MICNKCGKSLPDDSIFCSSCGNKLIFDKTEDSSTKNGNYKVGETGSVKRKNLDKTHSGNVDSTKIIVIIAIVLFASVILFKNLSFLTDNTKPKEAVSVAEYSAEAEAGPASEEYIDIESPLTREAAAETDSQGMDYVEISEDEKAELDAFSMYIAPYEPRNDQNVVLCVERNGTMYDLGWYYHADIIEKYDVGMKPLNITDGHDFVELFKYDAGRYDYESECEWENVKTDTPLAILTVGDVPIMKINRNETLRGYNNFVNLNLTATEFVGYTIPVIMIDAMNVSRGTAFPIVNHNPSYDNERKLSILKDQYGICDLNEKPVDDFRDLNYGEEYIFYWYSGTDYYEEKMVADCKVFKGYKSDDKQIDYSLEGKVTKNGYAEFDISDVKPGFYITDTNVVIEIVDDDYYNDDDLKG